MKERGRQYLSLCHYPLGDPRPTQEGVQSTMGADRASDLTTRGR